LIDFQIATSISLALYESAIIFDALEPFADLAALRLDAETVLQPVLIEGVGEDRVHQFGALIDIVDPAEIFLRLDKVLAPTRANSGGDVKTRDRNLPRKPERSADGHI
jgi:hypothetical protein